MEEAYISCFATVIKFAIETDVSMKVSYCVFCGEPLDDESWEDEDEIFEESV